MNIHSNKQINSQQNKGAYHIFFGNLANPLRVEIISQLKSKDLSVNELSKKLGVEQSKLSHALAGLRSCNIVNVKPEGKNRVYSINKKTILPILELIDKHSKANCSEESCQFCSRC